MQTEYERSAIEHEIIIRESKKTKLISLSLLVSVAVYAAIAYFVPGRPMRWTKQLWELFTIVSIVMVIVILGLRRTIYFSPRILKNKPFDATALLRKWSVIDIGMLAFGEAIAMMGLVSTLTGMPFDRTFHFFVAAFGVIMIVMPIPWKVKDKLRNFRNHMLDE